MILQNLEWIGRQKEMDMMIGENIMDKVQSWSIDRTHTMRESLCMLAFTFCFFRGGGDYTIVPIRNGYPDR